MVTIYDVAWRASVTPATVSNVVHGKANVGPETRARVQAAIKELGYRPNLVARSLVQRRSCILALLLPNIANPFYPEIALEVEKVADAHGYQLLLCNTHYEADRGRAHLTTLLERRVDGLVAMAGGLELADVERAAAQGLPTVLCNWEEEQRSDLLPTVDVDFRHGGELAAQHLVALGHRRVGLIVHGDARHAPAHANRREGFRATLEQAGVPVPQECERYGDSTLESGYQAAMDLLALPTPPTAVFATNDLMAVGAVEAAVDRGLSVPAQFSVVGFDDILLSAHVRPGLTAVAIPKRELATEAMELLLRHIGGKEERPSHLAVRPYLVVRQSTAVATQEAPAE